MPSNKKIIGTVELVILIIALVLIAFIVLKNNGGSIYERSETIQITDNPSTEGGEKHTRNYEMQEEDRVEVILQQLSEQFTAENNSIQKDRIIRDQTISEDELNYLEEIKKRHSHEETSNNPSDWLSILQASHKTYKKIKSVFEDANPSDKKVQEDNILKTLENELVANIVYSKIEELFQIPEEDARAFGEKGKKAVSDWAEFVEQNQSQKGQ